MLRTILTLLTLLCILPIQAAPTGRAFVTNERSNSLSVLDTESLELIQTLPIGKRPRGIGLAPDGSELYIALSDENRIVVLDPDTLQVLRGFPAGSDPETFAVHPNGKYLHLQRRRCQGHGVRSAGWAPDR